MPSAITSAQPHSKTRHRIGAWRSSIKPSLINQALALVTLSATNSNQQASNNLDDERIEFLN